MEKHQLDRREKIAAAIVLATIGGVALKVSRGDRMGIARHYPGGSFFIDSFRYTGNKASARLAFFLKSINPLEMDFGDIEHSDAELDEFENTFKSVVDGQES